ncbi:MAG TPA: phage terminase large subunit [Bryobacteraceae bacterium]|nr:phage terminase large subunit [Bryobacteraceae bacterium]
MLAGGSRSGKTFLEVRAIMIRALKAPGSRHAIMRFRFGHVKQSIVHDTFPKVRALCFPDVDVQINRSDWFARFPGGSEVWFGGLDDKERTEKILGSEYATIMLNECSQIPYNSRNMAVTRLAQLVTDTVTKKPLPLKMYYDENPPDKGHWTYKLFKTKQDPETKTYLTDPDNYGFMQLNPYDNKENLSPDYIKTLESLPLRLRKRFLEGEFRDQTPNALFIDENLERWRHVDGDLPDMLRLVVAVDPSGADDEENIDNDEIGISVCGLGIDGNGYVLQDLTLKAGPATWGRVAVQAYMREKADRIVGEVNFGGAMVGHVIRTAAMEQKTRIPFRSLTASRGKVVRAEPISALFETGKCRIVGYHRDLEDELSGFTTYGFTGDHSPNRADAMIWALSDLFPELLASNVDKQEKAPVQVIQRSGPNSWMHR